MAFSRECEKSAERLGRFGVSVRPGTMKTGHLMGRMMGERGEGTARDERNSSRAFEGKLDLIRR
jgi:hypothetical protein